jgi:hypothetical protein
LVLLAGEPVAGSGRFMSIYPPVAATERFGRRPVGPS